MEFGGRGLILDRVHMCNPFSPFIKRWDHSGMPIIPDPPGIGLPGDCTMWRFPSDGLVGDIVEFDCGFPEHGICQYEP